MVIPRAPIQRLVDVVELEIDHARGRINRLAVTRQLGQADRSTGPRVFVERLERQSPVVQARSRAPNPTRRAEASRRGTSRLGTRETAAAFRPQARADRPRRPRRSRRRRSAQGTTTSQRTPERPREGPRARADGPRHTSRRDTQELAARLLSWAPVRLRRGRSRRRTRTWWVRTLEGGREVLRQRAGERSLPNPLRLFPRAIWRQPMGLPKGGELTAGPPVPLVRQRLNRGEVSVGRD